MDSESKTEFVEKFKIRTRSFVVDTITLFRKLPKTEEAKIIGRQLLRSSSSVGANYRAACRARSQAEFYAKLSIVVEEADETLFWFEILTAANIASTTDTNPLVNEITEILKVVSKARKNAKITAN